MTSLLLLVRQTQVNAAYQQRRSVIVQHSLQQGVVFALNITTQKHLHLTSFNYKNLKAMMSLKILATRILILFLFLFLVLSNAHSQDNRLTAKEKRQGWQLLFDGTSMSKWRSASSDSFPSKGWTIENGVLAIRGGGESGGDIITKQQFDDFELSVDFKLTEGANSGIKYSVHLFHPPIARLGAALGPEYQLLDNEKHPDAKAGINGNRKLSSLYDILPSNTGSALRPVGEWNTARIVSKGNHVEHYLNGIKVLEYDKGSNVYKEAFALSKFKEVKGYGESTNGYILLQDHGNKVYFKNIKIRKL